jgi:hypothetical protein
MKTTLFKIGAAIAWAGAAIVSASPANAMALTWQSGDYAACSSNYYYGQYTATCDDGASGTQYIDFNAVQHIRFIQAACNSGNCAADSFDVQVEFLYGTGRKRVSGTGMSCGGMNLYGIDTCAC